jgi:hypothetical protein
MKRLKLILGLLIALSPISLRATDNPIYPTGTNFTLSSVAWGNGPQAFNNNFFFTPLVNSGAACIYVYNNNPTNAHQFNATITGTANAQNRTPSDGTWQFIPGNPGAGVVSGGIAPISPGIPVILTASLSGFSQISINLSGSSALGGSPDTASIVIIQTQGTCGAGPIADPCQNSQFTKISAPVSFSGTTVTQVIPLVSGKTIYVCGYSLGVTGTAPTITWVFGTGANCGTGLASISGAIPITTGSNVTIPTTSAQFQSALSNAVCIQAGGTTPTVAGYVTWIYQ